jgi:hypothetical protein
MLAAACLALVCHLPAADAVAGTETRPRTAFVNARISSREVALNQTVRVEFTTMPRQVVGMDIAATVANAVALDSRHWRLVVPPVVVEQDKTRTVSVTLTLLPRITGDLALPQVPVAWLGNDQVAELGQVAVADAVAVGPDRAPVPKEVQGVAGFAWGASLAELTAPGAALAAATPAIVQDRTEISPQDGLTLIFRGGTLGEATLAAPQVALDRCKAEFLRRWGMPHEETAEQLTWIIGWIRIEATAAGAGVRLRIQREDIQARIDRDQVQDGVFRILDR